uniref:FERM domain-containing protein n=1 Tax=Glossina palpalis gambiensis TaxID=67801 RepID=A0A1B0BJE5_9MUSC
MLERKTGWKTRLQRKTRTTLLIEVAEKPFLMSYIIVLALFYTFLKQCYYPVSQHMAFGADCFFKTQGTRRRQWPPSREEILCTVNRRPCYARFYFMDGQFYSIEFHPSSTALEVMEIIKRKIGLQQNSMGYAIYEVLGNTERSLLFEEKLADVMAKFTKRLFKHNLKLKFNPSVNGIQQTPGLPVSPFDTLIQGEFKHLFFDDYINLDDPVEKELLYHQVLHSLRSERFPISEIEAIMLTALQGQLETADCGEVIRDYRVIASHCLPPRFVPNIPHEAVAMHHQSLRGMLPAEAKKSFLNLIQSWPLHRATIFDVMNVPGGTCLENITSEYYGAGAKGKRNFYETRSSGL